ncbi:hypothetical protein [Leeuwenhoekiella sp. CH_XMU1409-2]|uniref:hypothetical protein n=1 Tax=Leeuwenhoekiella sp. CH_XMU1409-2 TaxID=3107768 RepID=UPI0030094AB4
MSYIRINVNKAAGGGAPIGKSADVVVWDLSEVASWAQRDGKKVAMVGNITMKPNKYATIIQATQSTISIPPASSEGDEDRVAFTQVPEFMHPGDSLEYEEFVANMTNKSLAVGFRIGGCDGESAYYKVYGTPCNPLFLITEGQDNNEGRMQTIRFQQATPSKNLPGRYYGTITYDTTPVVAADTTDVDVAAGEGRYQLSDNAAATVITTLSNAVNQGVYTLLGSGGENPASITAANDFILAGAVEWTGDAGATLTVRAYAQDGGNFLFIEESRS